MNTPLKNALFAAESVAHLRGYEREILPLADLARGMDARIAELESALLALVATFHAENPKCSSGYTFHATEILARTVQPAAQSITP